MEYHNSFIGWSQYSVRRLLSFIPLYSEWLQDIPFWKKYQMIQFVNFTISCIRLYKTSSCIFTNCLQIQLFLSSVLFVVWYLKGGYNIRNYPITKLANYYPRLTWCKVGQGNHPDKYLCPRCSHFRKKNSKICSFKKSMHWAHFAQIVFCRN